MHTHTHTHTLTHRPLEPQHTIVLTFPGRNIRWTEAQRVYLPAADAPASAVQLAELRVLIKSSFLWPASWSVASLWHHQHGRLEGSPLPLRFMQQGFYCNLCQLCSCQYLTQVPSLLRRAAPAVCSLICVFIMTVEGEYTTACPQTVIFCPDYFRTIGRVDTGMTGSYKHTHRIHAFRRRGEGGSSPDFSRWHTSPPELCPSLRSAASCQQTRCTCCRGRNWNRWSTIKKNKKQAERSHDVILTRVSGESGRTKIVEMILLFTHCHFVPGRQLFWLRDSNAPSLLHVIS